MRTRAENARTIADLDSGGSPSPPSTLPKPSNIEAPIAATVGPLILGVRIPVFLLISVTSALQSESLELAPKMRLFSQETLVYADSSE